MRTTFLIGIVALCALAGAIPAAHAQDCDYPLFIKQGSVDANVMILFDSSGSMNEAIMHDDYDPTRRYSGNFSRTNDYNITTSGLYSPLSFNSRWPSTPTAYLVASDGGQAGVYNGNYLNWVFSSATATQRNAIPRVTRIQMAKAAVNTVIAGADARVRFGLWKFNGSTGGTQLAAMGTDRGTIQTRVSSIVGNGYTPLAESLAMIATEFKKQDASAPIQYACQRNFVVICTDGLPTQDDNSGFTDNNGNGYALDEVAEYLKDTDLRTDDSVMPGKQYVNTYTIGMNIDAPVLADAAQRGDGSYFSASNANELALSLQRVLRDIVNRISSGSAVAVVSTEGDETDYLYRGKFLPKDWSGYLEAFQLPYVTGDLPVWEAGQLLIDRGASTRTVFTSVNGQRVDFTSAQAGNLRVALGAANDTVADEIIRWTRGEDITGYRQRGFILGDIVDSSPVPVGPPAGYSLLNDYNAFQAANANRERVIYVGSNDGMLHCFLASTGEELWAYVPNDQLDQLYTMMDEWYCHQFAVNLTPRAADVYVNNAWRTVVIGGEKQGGDAYFAIDVTDPYNPQFMWENHLADVVASWAQVEVVHMKATGEYIGFVGSGLNPAGEARLIGFNLADGTLEYNIMLSDNGGTDFNMATAGTAIDLNLDEYEDVLYVSDLEGNLWSVDLTGSSPDKSLLFATPGQPIQAQPICTVDYNSDVYIYFGTGKYVEASDMSDVSPQTYYCIIDRHDGQTVDKNELVDQTRTINKVAAAPGWYVDLENLPGERVTEPNAIVAGIVYFTSYAPRSAPCSSGGVSYLYGVQFRNGAAYDGDEDSDNDTISGRSSEIGDGIVAKPVIDIINEKVLVQGSDTRIHSQDTFGQIRQLIVRSWQQQY
jgi:type IV pilus assembly protein PilY1